MSYLSTKEIARDTGLTTRAIQKYIKEGFLPADLTYQANHKIYQVDQREYLEWRNKYFQGIKRGSISKRNSSNKPFTKADLLSLIQEWLTALGDSSFNGKVYSHRTIETYDYAVDQYIKHLGSNPEKPLISKANLKIVFSEIPSIHYAKKLKIYEAITCLSKFLIDIGKLEKSFSEEIKSLKPKRFIPPKRITLSETEINKIINAIDIFNGNSYYDKLLSKTLIIFLKETGLRASELCNLKIQEVNLNDYQVYVRLGKGNRDRRVGITQTCDKAIREYLKIRLERFECDSSSYFFVSSQGLQLTRNSLRLRWDRLSLRTGIKITSHSFRRAFVTLNVNRGKPLVHLQIAAGHSDIKTTRGYCMTSQDEVVASMRDW
jgi:integrase